MLSFRVCVECGVFRSFVLQGHASGVRGESVLCAGISVLSQSIILGLRDVLRLQVSVERSDGYLRCVLPDDMTPGERDAVDVLMRTFICAMNDLCVQFPREIVVELC